MFKKFDEKEDVSSTNNVKSSVIKGFRNTILSQFPHLEKYMEEILPKKEALKVTKCHNHVELLLNKDNEPVFFKQRDGHIYPTMRLLHQYPFMMPHMQVDKGAIKFILSGANIMCPGLTSPGAKMTKVDKESIVAIMAEGKEHAVGIGLTKLSAEEILEVNKGVGVELIHYIGDGLWHIRTVKN